jgi:hypothetical protein
MVAEIVADSASDATGFSIGPCSKPWHDETVGLSRNQYYLIVTFRSLEECSITSSIPSRPPKDVVCTPYGVLTYIPQLAPRVLASRRAATAWCVRGNVTQAFGAHC